MKVEYVGRHYEIDERGRKFTEGKLRKLDKFLQEPVDVRITLEAEKYRHRADLHLSHRFGVIQATEETDDMLDSILQAVDKAEKQARRSSEKFQSKRRRSERETAHSWPLAVLDGETMEKGGEPKVMQSLHYQVQFMGLDEAASSLNESERDFVVFRNLDNDQVNVLYRRADGNYGLISPEF